MHLAQRCGDALFGTGQWRRIVPTSWGGLGEAWDSLKIYAGFGVPSIEHFQPYDALQQIMYFLVVFVLAPLMIVTGPAMSPRWWVATRGTQSCSAAATRC